MDMSVQEYQKGYESGSKHGYRQGYKEGYKEGYESGVETGRKAAIKAVSGLSDISDATLNALYKMGKKRKLQPETKSVFEACPCLTCIDGGIDMPYCEGCPYRNASP